MENNPSFLPVVGIDIGRVLMSATDPDGTADTSFLSGSDLDALETPPTPGALAALATLVDRCDGRVWLVSKCGARVADLTRRWLVHQGVYTRTGLRPEQVRFCKERKGKAPICLEVGVTHFVDDRADVHRHLAGIVPFRFLFGYQSGPAPAELVHVRDWGEALRALIATGV